MISGVVVMYVLIPPQGHHTAAEGVFGRVLMVPITGFVAGFTKKFQQALMKAKDIRLRYHSPACLAA